VRVRAIVFDFDCSILDTESTELQGWQEVYAEYCCELRRARVRNSVPISDCSTKQDHGPIYPVMGLEARGSVVR